MKHQNTKATYAGINPNFNLKHFSQEEKNIINELQKYFYLTNGGTNINHGTATYRYCLLKLTTDKNQIFGINFEMIALFSPYENFEPRTLDVIEKIEEKINSNFRVDKICTIVISKCSNFLDQLNNILRDKKESKVIIPFTYDELLSDLININNFYDSRIKNYFFQRDLFDFQAPLTKDLYFFGRDNVVHSLIDKHNQHEACGIFGLRKSGKTSILHAIHRSLPLQNNKKSVSVIIDCQEIYTLDWNQALFKIINIIDKELHTKINPDKDSYSYNANNFDEDIKKISNKIKKKILIIFDEIEQLTYGVSGNPHWREGIGYLYFWNTIRASFQKPGSVFTFLIAGTNPSCVEISQVGTADNPLFQQFKPYYLEGFSVENTKQMVSTLAKYMGVKFDEEIYTYLTDNFGGHPFLIRQTCSFLFKKMYDIKKYNDNLLIDKDFYRSNIDEFFNEKSFPYCEMIISVLEKTYPDEYTMLEYLAQGKLRDFNELAENDFNYVRHLIGYGIVRKSNTIHSYNFNISIIKEFLIKKNKYTPLLKSTEEKLQFISNKRNELELQLRIFIKDRLRNKYGIEKAKDEVIRVFNLHNNKLKYEEIFDPSKNQSLYFLSLKNLITDSTLWQDCFKDIFQKQERISSKFNMINDITIGRADAHAVEIKDNDYEIAISSINSILDIINDYEENY